MNKKTALRLILLAFITLTVLFIAPFLGMGFISIHDIVHDPMQKDIFFSLRVPRVLTAFIAGAGLAVCGMIFQAMFRNPLADPFTLGIASGASCGASIMILSGFSGAVLGISFLSLGAFAGAAVSMALVYGLSSIKRASSNLTMLLAGIAVSFLFSSLLMFFQYLSSLRDSFHIVRWLMGGIEVFGYKQILTMLPFTFAGLVIVFAHLPHLDQLLAGEDIARSRGVNIKLTKNMLLVGATLIVGSVVSVCGPIGFIGLLAPHLCRRIFLPGHQVLGPATFMLGGTFLVVCDIIARIVIAPAEIPVGVITALLGGPFFLYVLFGRHGGGVRLD